MQSSLMIRVTIPELPPALPQVTEKLSLITGGSKSLNFSGGDRH